MTLPVLDTLTQRALNLVTHLIGENMTNLRMAQLAGNDDWTANVHGVLAIRRPQRRRLQERLDNAHNPECPRCRFPMHFEPATSDGAGRQYPASYGCPRGCGVTITAEVPDDEYDPRDIYREVYEVEPEYLEGDGPMVPIERRA